MRGTTFVLLVSAALVPWVGGCATVGSLSGKDDNKVFGGARLDATLISEGLSSDSKASKTQEIERPLLLEEACCGLVDMPLSIVADTVLLPITVPLAMQHHESQPQSEKPMAANRDE
jgi:uncharacterized protein YceK